MSSAQYHLAMVGWSSIAHGFKVWTNVLLPWLRSLACQTQAAFATYRPDGDL